MARRRTHAAALVAAMTFSAAALALPSPAEAPAREIECGMMIRAGMMIEGIAAPLLHVLNRSEADPPLSAALSPYVVNVGCRRTTIIPGPNDDAVVTRGIPLTIVEEGTGRALALDLAAGRYRYRMQAGALTDQEAALVARRLAEFQARRQIAPH